MKKFHFNLVIALILVCISISTAAEIPPVNLHKKQGIHVEVTTFFGDKQIYKQDDIISFLVSLDQDAYLLLIYEDANGDLYQIIPNRYRKNNRYEQGLFVAVPNQDEPFQFRVSPPFGTEILWAFASKKTFPNLNGSELTNGITKLSSNINQLLKMIRGNLSKNTYGEAKTVIRTEPK